jgi:hypothetical protein
MLPPASDVKELKSHAEKRFAKGSNPQWSVLGFIGMSFVKIKKTFTYHADVGALFALSCNYLRAN